MNVFKRKFAGFTGYVLVGLTCIFVVIRFVESRPLEVLAQSTTSFLFVVSLSGVAYAAINLLLAVAWLVILTYAENRYLCRCVCIGAYAQSQIAKYVPGNVFHFVGRHMLGRRIGLSHHSQILSVGLESVGLITAAASLAVVGAAVLYGPGTLQPGLSLLFVAGLTAVGILAFVCLPLIARRFGFKLIDGFRYLRGGRIVLILSLYMVFFLVFGLIAWALAGAIVGFEWRFLPAIACAVPTAWIVGFVTPGAPAGLGVREASLIALLGETLGAGEAVVVALALRIVTLLGDTLFFGLGLALRGGTIEGGTQSTDSAGVDEAAGDSVKH